MAIILCVLSIMVIMLVSKTKDVGSIPSARAKIFVSTLIIKRMEISFFK